MALTEMLKKRKKINMSECCPDAKFVPTKKGGTCVCKTKCGKGTKVVAHHKKNRPKQATQDGRRGRRYKRRFKVERFFS